MKKYTTLFFLALVSTMALNSQVRVSYSVGYGDYNMSDMNKVLDNSLFLIELEFPTGVAITDRFPGYITHNIDATYHLKRHEFGIKGTYLTTGGKIAYSDYSGEYFEKITLNGYRVGAMYRFHFLKSQIGNLPLSFYGELSPAITFTSLKYNALLNLPEYDVHETPEDVLSTNETGYSIQPLIGAQLFLTRNIFFNVSAGYDFEFGAKLSTANNLLRVDWTGFRANGGVGFSF